jgi:ankyrin repeat protein
MLLTPNKLRLLIAIETCKSRQEVPLIDVFQHIDLEHKLDNSITFLMLAAVNANFEVVSFLLNNGVNPNVRNSQGYSSLDLVNSVYESTKDAKYIPVIRLLDNISN